MREKKKVSVLVAAVILVVAFALILFAVTREDSNVSGNGSISGTNGTDAAEPSQPAGTEAMPTGSTEQSTAGSSDGSSEETSAGSPAETFTVTFYGPDGQAIYFTEVMPGAAAVPPENPTMPQGYIFSHWDRDLSCVEADLAVRAVCQRIEGQENVLALGGGYVQAGDEVVIPMQLCGQVRLCAFDVRIDYDREMLEFVEFRNQDGAVDANCIEQTGEICLNFVSMENTEGEVYLAELVFRAVGKPGQTHVEIDVAELIAYDADYRFYEPSHGTVSGTVTVAAP